jgi:hypothetical protein
MTSGLIDFRITLSHWHWPCEEDPPRGFRVRAQVDNCMGIESISRYQSGPGVRFSRRFDPGLPLQEDQRLRNSGQKVCSSHMMSSFFSSRLTAGNLSAS